MFYFFKVRVSIRTCMPNLGAVRRERFLTIYNPLNPPGVGVGQIFFLRCDYLSAHACKIWAPCGPTATARIVERSEVKDRTNESTDGH